MAAGPKRRLLQFGGPLHNRTHRLDASKDQPVKLPHLFDRAIQRSEIFRICERHEGQNNRNCAAGKKILSKRVAWRRRARDYDALPC
jgi:hypothetical protein